MVPEKNIYDHKWFLETQSKTIIEIIGSFCLPLVPYQTRMESLNNK